MTEEQGIDLGPDPSLLLVDDDEAFVKRLAKAMEKRGFRPETAGSVAAARAIVLARPPAYAVIDLRLEDGNGLEVVETLRERRADCRIVVLTGYGAIATAVAAVKIGATDYLSKPADANDVTAALLSKPGHIPEPPENPMSADRVRWEHIQRVYEMCDRNVSETARRLSIPLARATDGRRRKGYERAYTSSREYSSHRRTRLSRTNGAACRLRRFVRR